jgi:FkbM family methyltransferase
MFFSPVSELNSFNDMIRAGATTKDKFLIAATEALSLSYPGVRLVSRVTGRSLFSPARIIPQYRCQNEFGTYECPGGRSSLMFSKDWEPSVKDLIRSLKGGLFLDVGANLGFYSVMASKVLGTRGCVVSIEPDPIYFSFLKTNISSNSCHNAELHRIAAWDSSDSLWLTPHQFGISGVDSSVSQTESSEKFKVNAMPLDDILEDRIPTMIKVDVEGAEKHVFKGLERTLRDSENVTLIYEAYSSQAFEEVARLLEEYGFTSKKLPDGNSIAAKI